jgi:hypothetical protein
VDLIPKIEAGKRLGVVDTTNRIGMETVRKPGLIELNLSSASGGLPLIYESLPARQNFSKLQFSVPEKADPFELSKKTEVFWS